MRAFRIGREEITGESRTITDTKNEMYAPRDFPFVNVVQQAVDDKSLSWVMKTQTLLHTLRNCRFQRRELNGRIGRLIQHEQHG